MISEVTFFDSDFNSDTDLYFYLFNITSWISYSLPNGALGFHFDLDVLFNFSGLFDELAGFDTIFSSVVDGEDDGIGWEILVEGSSGMRSWLDRPFSIVEVTGSLIEWSGGGWCSFVYWEEKAGGGDGFLLSNVVISVETVGLTPIALRS